MGGLGYRSPGCGGLGCRSLGCVLVPGKFGIFGVLVPRKVGYK